MVDEFIAVDDVLLLSYLLFVCLFVTQEKSELQKRDQSEWEKVFLQLLQTLRTGITLCIEQGLLCEEEKEIFFVSGIYVTHSPRTVRVYV